MTRQRTSIATGLWSRAAQALGKLWAGVVSLPDDRRQPNGQTTPWTDYPRFPPY
jgi:hypothetical protein